MHFHNVLLYPLGKCAINQLNKPESLTPMRFFLPGLVEKGPMLLSAQCSKGRLHILPMSLFILP